MKNNFRLLKKFFYLCLILGQLVLMTGCSIFKPNENSNKPEDPDSVIDNWGKESFNYFNTVSRIYSYAGETKKEFDKTYDDAASLLSEYHELFDIYYEYSGKNNLYTLNKNAGGEPIKFDSKLIEFLNYTKEMYKLTNGETNVMLGSVLKIWHNCRSAATDPFNPQPGKLPDMNKLKEAAKHTSIDLLEIDTENNTARITDPLASIDVGAIGKGYATEKVAQMIEQSGKTNYLLNIGGNIRAIGSKPDGSGWNTGITDPFNKEVGICSRINLKDISCVTSGVYERFYIVDGKRYHHIIDKDTLMPAEGYASITILTKDSGFADALSTGLFTMPFEEGYKLVESLEGVEVLWVLSNGTQKKSSGYSNFEIK